jgi:putative alpha-1,2-mannosidase
VFLQATRQNWTGEVFISPERREISGSNPQRQDYKLGPSRGPKFRGYFVSRFSEPFESYGVAHGGHVQKGVEHGEGELLGAYATFASGTKRVEVRTGVSFVSVEQARANLDAEVPDDATFEKTVNGVKQAWLDVLGVVTIEGVNKTDKEHDQRTIFYTGLFHALQYPNDYSEPMPSKKGNTRTFYSGYTDSAHVADDSYYQSWSIWVRSPCFHFIS